MSIWNTVKRVAVIVWGVVSKLQPLMDLIGQLVPSIADELEAVSDFVEDGGEIADDFIDANRDKFLKVREFSMKLSEAGVGLTNVIDALLAAADDDEVTVEELEAIYELLREAIEAVAAAGIAAQTASTAMKEVTSD